MKMKYRIKEAMQFLTFAFYPRTTLIACAVISVIVIVILGIVMAFIPQDSGSYNMVYEVSGDKIEAVYMIPGWTHNIINLSETENLVTVMTCNEVFDKRWPDTFGEVV